MISLRWMVTGETSNRSLRGFSPTLPPPVSSHWLDCLNWRMSIIKCLIAYSRLFHLSRWFKICSVLSFVKRISFKYIQATYQAKWNLLFVPFFHRSCNARILGLSGLQKLHGWLECLSCGNKLKSQLLHLEWCVLITIHYLRLSTVCRCQ